ncbi:SBBP repeat-containing protein [Sorangium sp. So ce327]|uniref:SBBP repeat-containing protein n=1 Tax=Sorangium sp. So ce327 TaxID=3133301 RepID=UPI003F616E5D
MGAFRLVPRSHVGSPHVLSFARRPPLFSALTLHPHLQALELLTLERRERSRQLAGAPAVRRRQTYRLRLESCEPGSQLSCYSGLPGTQGVGRCTAGARTCLPDGSGYGPCTGEITPSAEGCASETDEDCDGTGQCSLPPLWSAALGGAGADAAYGVATDAAGNLYVTGAFEGTVDFGAGPLTATGRDGFVAVLAP